MKLDEFAFVNMQLAGMLQSGMMVPHVGARGGTTLIAKFKGMVDSGKMDATGLTVGLGEWKKFLTTYSKEGDLKGWGKKPVCSVLLTVI